jgi:hypothetical protein
MDHPLPILQPLMACLGLVDVSPISTMRCAATSYSLPSHSNADSSIFFATLPYSSATFRTRPVSWARQLRSSPRRFTSASASRTSYTCSARTRRTFSRVKSAARTPRRRRRTRPKNGEWTSQTKPFSRSSGSADGFFFLSLSLSSFLRVMSQTMIACVKDARHASRHRTSRAQQQAATSTPKTFRRKSRASHATSSFSSTV